MSKKATAKPAAMQYPEGIEAADTTYPKSEDSFTWSERQEAGLDDIYSLTFHRVSGDHARKERGWMIATLFISKGHKGQPDRTYAIGVDDEKVYTVGNGPHVSESFTLHFSKSNHKRLAKYVALYKKGLADASAIRDRISSRRAQGQVHRANGRTSWMW